LSIFNRDCSELGSVERRRLEDGTIDVETSRADFGRLRARQPGPSRT
jgi:hypothetical protein